MAIISDNNIIYRKMFIELSGSDSLMPFIVSPVKDLMRSKNTSGYFSFYIDNISIKHIPFEIFKNSH